MQSLGLVCVGGGRGERFGGDKLGVRLAEVSVFERSLLALRRAFREAPMVVVVPPDRVEHWAGELLTAFSDAEIVAGGARRQDSVRAGVEAASASAVDVVLVHDAARPLVHPDDVRLTFEALGDAAGAVLCAPITDTVKVVCDDGSVIETLDRGRLRAALTPQVFRVESLRASWRKTDPEVLWTDEAALLEATGLPVRWVLAGHPNPKITTAADLELVRALVGGGR